MPSATVLTIATYTQRNSSWLVCSNPMTFTFSPALSTIDWITASGRDVSLHTADSSHATVTNLVITITGTATSPDGSTANYDTWQLYSITASLKHAECLTATIGSIPELPQGSWSSWRQISIAIYSHVELEFSDPASSISANCGITYTIYSTRASYNTVTPPAT